MEFGRALRISADDDIGLATAYRKIKRSVWLLVFFGLPDLFREDKEPVSDILFSVLQTVPTEIFIIFAIAR